jgi:hypothetical protein
VTAALACDVSVVVPVTERPEPLAELYEEYAEPLRTAGYSFEFIFATLPANTGLLGDLRELVAQGAPIRVLEFGHSVGEASILKVAASHSRGRILVTLPAYRQVESSALLPLIAKAEEVDLVVAWRWPRTDARINRIQNRLLHTLVGGLAGGRLHDVSCGVRAMRPELIQNVRLYGDVFRFFPLLARREGYAVEELPSPLHPAALKPRTYPAGTYFRRLLDIMGLVFLLRFTDKPLRFFGLLGGSLALTGSIILVAMFLTKVLGAGIATRPFLLFGVLLLVLGVQAIALGLIGEMIVHLNASRRANYRFRGEGLGPRVGERRNRIRVPPAAVSSSTRRVESA